MITDTTFFTNEPGYALIDRIRKTRKASSGVFCEALRYRSLMRKKK